VAHSTIRKPPTGDKGMCLVLIAAEFLVMTGLLVLSVPKVESVFQGFGPDLPAFTRFVFNFSRGLRSVGLYVLIGLTASAYALSHFRKPSELMRGFFSRVSLTTLNIVMLSVAAMVMAITVAMLLPIFELAPAS